MKTHRMHLSASLCKVVITYDPFTKKNVLLQHNVECIKKLHRGIIRLDLRKCTIILQKGERKYVTK